ncbi:MAG: hypothetical protein IPO22_09345 [Anaerolineales bacterium]|nr:hypothetical protein [Anaerolineales bacterium]
MIILYREEKSSSADVIEAEFRELVLGYDRVVVDASQAATLFDETHILPVIKNNERVVSGDDIPVYLKELTKLMHDWQLFQNHCCSVDDGSES